MKYFLLSVFFLLVFFDAKSQLYESLDEPVRKTCFSKFLNDSVSVEILLPIEYSCSQMVSYPVFYLLDKQNTVNYHYNLHTIDYLTTFGTIPNAIVIGISFDPQKRTKWTVPDTLNGKADKLIDFITRELYLELKKEYRVSGFNLLIGHSRTAIFSLYAISRRPDFFNGVIASSASNFDFNDKYQKQQFRSYLDTLSKIQKNHFIYFSSGLESHGDMHESACDSLADYLKTKPVPKNLQWKYFKLNASHTTTPSQTVILSLVDIFSDYERCIHNCFEIINSKTNSEKVPWEKFFGEYNKLSEKYSYELLPGLSFFFSIASAYENDYNHLFNEKSLQFSEEVIDKGLEIYPNNKDLIEWKKGFDK